ncbi:GyrI-like domain-containing protein [Botryobacter ruber]|uniref:GyrI-like domain-containing protein n=1 Tax=Botryobacter ruber TaxID=2171629 RepID=UPI000E0CB391|nr:GyrI-like domain-containing protein [Botryobacter ruber]
MNKTFLLVMAVLVIIVVAFYAYLGGFSSADVTTATSQPLYVAGQPVKAHIKDEQLGKAFQRASEVLEKNELEGVLGNIYYNNPEKGKDSVKAFIGVVVPDTTVNLPAGFELRKVPGGRKVVRAEVDAHYMLSPNKLYAAVFEYAEEQNLKLEEFYVEWFPEDHKGVVEVPVIP